MVVNVTETWSDRLGGWAVLLLLAALLALGSELLLWQGVPAWTLDEWLLKGAGYVLLAALLLDTAVRFRVRDAFDVLLLAGIYGLCAALLLNPETMLANLPETLITRVLGAHTLLGLEMLALWLVLTGGRRPRVLPLLLPSSGVVGLAWGTWLRWTPGLGDPAVPVLLLAVLLLLCGALLLVLRRGGQAVRAEAMRLQRRGLSLLLVGLIGIFALRYVQFSLDPAWLVLIGLILAVCYVILWFRRPETRTGFMPDHLPAHLPPLWWLLFTAVGFGGAALLAYQAPELALFGRNQLVLVSGGFFLWGIGWLPFACAVLGLQAYTRQVRTSPL